MACLLAAYAYAREAAPGAYGVPGGQGDEAKEVEGGKGETKKRRTKE